MDRSEIKDPLSPFITSVKESKILFPEDLEEVDFSNHRWICLGVQPEGVGWEFHLESSVAAHGEE